MGKLDVEEYGTYDSMVATLLEHKFLPEKEVLQLCLQPPPYRLCVVVLGVFRCRAGIWFRLVRVCSAWRLPG